MKNNLRHFFGLLGVSLALISHAAFALTPGQRLSDAQIAQFGQLAVYDLGGSNVRVLPSPPSNDQETLLIDKQGVVGSSRNEVVISEASAQSVDPVLQRTLPAPTSLQRYEPTGMIVVRYGNFDEAVKGLRALKAALPDAKVSLPLKFGKHVPY